MVIGSDLNALVAGLAAADKGALLLFTPVMPGSRQAELTCNQNEIVAAGIPALDALAPARAITIRPSGSREDWPAKVGNPAKITEHFPLEVSTFAGHTGNDLFSALLPVLGQSVNGWDAGRDSIRRVVDALAPDAIINTAPRALFCERLDEHLFTRRPVWSSADIGPAVPEGEVWVNAEDAPAWYTTSCFDGLRITRWLVKPPFESVREDSFPISTNCDCAPVEMVHAGAEAECNPALTLADVYSRASAALLSEES